MAKKEVKGNNPPAIGCSGSPKKPALAKKRMGNKKKD
jgi:hypothetical protein